MLFSSFRREISIIRKKSAILSGLAALTYTSIPVLLSVISLLLTGQPLTPVNAFMLLMFMNLLRQNFCLTIGFHVLGTYEAFVSFGRIEDFLNISEDLSSMLGNQCMEDKCGAVEEKLINFSERFYIYGRSVEKIKRRTWYRSEGKPFRARNSLCVQFNVKGNEKEK